jgi:hypothetical protein
MKNNLDGIGAGRERLHAHHRRAGNRRWVPSNMFGGVAAREIDFEEARVPSYSLLAWRRCRSASVK